MIRNLLEDEAEADEVPLGALWKFSSRVRGTILSKADPTPAAGDGVTRVLRGGFGLGKGAGPFPEVAVEIVNSPGVGRATSVLRRAPTENHAVGVDPFASGILTGLNLVRWEGCLPEGGFVNLGGSVGDGLSAGFVEFGPEAPETGRTRNDGTSRGAEEGLVVDVIPELREEEPAFGNEMGLLGFEEALFDPFQNDFAFGIGGLPFILRGHVVEADLFLDHAPCFEMVRAEVHGEIMEGEFSLLFFLTVSVGAVVLEEGCDGSRLVGLGGGERE